MKLAVCVDDELGMTFDGKRQSRDRVLIADLIKHANGTPIYISPYSEKLFPDYEGKYVVSDMPLDAAGEDDYVFIENIAPEKYSDKFSEIIIYHWNRSYPCETWFEVDLTPYRIVSRSEFEGSSHEKITKEVYVR